MQLDVRHAQPPQLVAELERLTRALEAQLGGLSGAQLNWKPSPAEWSLGQCLEHIIVANSSYFGTLEELAAGRRRSRLRERLPVLPALFGWLLIFTLDPARQMKLKTAKIFEPTSSAVDPQILAAFARQQARLAELMRACAGLDAGRIVITSPANPLVTYSLLDAFRIIVVHEQHHLAHAARLLALPEFPPA